MSYELVKKIFKYSLDLISFIQASCMILSFFIILYWLIQLAGLSSYVEPFAPFFESIKGFIHFFYNRTVVIDKAVIDFSFLIAVIILLLLAFGLKYVVEYIEIIEKELDSFNIKQKKKQEEKFNKTLEQEYLIEEYKNNKFLFLINFSVEDTSKDSFYTRSANEGAEEKAAEVLAQFSNLVGEKLNCQKKNLEEGLLLFFNDFEKIDSVLFTLKEMITDLKEQYKPKNWKIRHFASMEVYASAKEVVLVVEKLIKLLKLKLSNKNLCLASLKQRYSLIKTQKNIIENVGVYNIIENQDVYSIKS